MEPLEFLAAVLPSAGVYCVAEFTSSRKEHVFKSTIAELIPTIERFNQEHKCTFVGQAGYATSADRTAENAKWMRSCFLDIEGGDGKAYPNKRAVAVALQEFLLESTLGDLGTPWMVASGGGVHVYWPFAEDIPVALWKPVAENLKRLCKKLKFNIDYSVTADAARVLRVPGTMNWKKKYAAPLPCEVRVVGAPKVFDFAAFAEIVREKVNGAAYKPLEEIGAVEGIAGVRPVRPEGFTGTKLAENNTASFAAIVKSGKCGQINHYLEHAAEDGMEPIWRGLLSLAQKCTDADRAVIKITKLHPYTEDRMRS